ncbi:MAG: hypothetical protein K5634_03720 [Sphaerochaetaceae bacterium]|nr:hypothetical protein [Sphaerochaetaceae bacterium]
MDFEKNDYQDIDVRALVSGMNPKLAKRIPGFVYRYAEKILHVDELNEHFRRTNDFTAEEFLDATVERLDIRIDMDKESLEELEKNRGRRVMVVSNHPFGGPEAMGLMSILIKIFPDIKLVAQSYLKIIKPLRSCCVFNKKEVRTLCDHVEEKKSVLIYPAGFCSRILSNGEIFDYRWKSSFLKIAKKLGMPVIVVHTYGQLSKRIFRWTKFRKIFGIKVGIESAFLSDEMFKRVGETLKMRVAKTIEPEVFDDRYTLDEWSQKLRQFCFNLRDNPKEEFDPNIALTLPNDKII